MFSHRTTAQIKKMFSAKLDELIALIVMNQLEQTHQQNNDLKQIDWKTLISIELCNNCPRLAFSTFSAATFIRIYFQSTKIEFKSVISAADIEWDNSNEWKNASGSFFFFSDFNGIGISSCCIILLIHSFNIISHWYGFVHRFSFESENSIKFNIESIGTSLMKWSIRIIICIDIGLQPNPICN